MLPSYKKISNFLKNGKIDHRCLSTWTSVMCYESHGAGTLSPMITSYKTRSLRKKMQLNILVSLYTINCLGTSIILSKVFSDETYKFTRHTSKLMHTRLLFDHKLSRRLLYGVLSPKRTKIKLRWYREELPALLATTTDAKQVSLTCLMSLAGAVSSREEQTKD